MGMAGPIDYMERHHLIDSKKDLYWKIKDNYLWNVKRTEDEFKAGLFHCEYEDGYSAAIFLSSKCYILAKQDKETNFEKIVKLACKGWQTKQRGAMSVEDFRQINRERKKHEVSLYSLRFSKSTYQFLLYTKAVLSFLNLKRFWLDDDVNSIAYDL